MFKFKNIKNLLKVSTQNLQITINQNMAEKATASGDINIKNPRKIVNVAEYFIHKKLECKKILLRDTEEKVKQYFALLKGRPINLLKENRDDLVIRQNSLLAPQQNFIISPETKIIDIFNSDEIGHKLLITGEAGSGKTITIIELAEALINQAKQDKDKPIPVLFKLSHWKDSSMSFFEWLVTELNNKYKVPIGQELINERQIIPLVDEFDEVNPKLLDSCLEEINEFLQIPIHFVICCRLKSYELSQNKLNLNGAICLQPLTEIQIEEYLQKIEKIENKNYKDFFNDIKNNAIIKEISKNPLFFSLFLSHSAYPIILTRKFKSINSLEEGEKEQILDILYDLHIDSRRKSEKGYRYKFDKTKLKQLAWLARKMQKNYMTEFCIEELQPTWLENNNGQQIIYRIGITLIFIVLFCFVFWQIGYEKYQLVIAIILGVVFGLTIGVRGGLSPTIEITESFIQKGVRYNELTGFIFGGIGGILGIVVDWLYDGLVDGVTLALTGFLIGALFGGIANADIAEIGDKQIPNQGIKDSALNAMVFTLVYGFIGALIFGSICWAINGWNDAFDCAQSAAISFGLCAGMVNGGNTCIQHYILRLVLYRSGIIRWNINHFLEQSASLMFLQRVGGRYSFIHSELRNYFARKAGKEITSRNFVFETKSKINSRKLIQQEAILLVEKIKLITEITGYSLKEWLTFEDVLIAEDPEENMLGVCLAYDFSSNWSFISVLFVLEEFRGNKISKKLFKEISEKLFKEACRKILSRKRNVYTSSCNPVVIEMMKQSNFILFDTLYVLPQDFKKYEFDFLLRGIKWITSFYRIKELSRKYLKYKDKRKFVYGIKSYE